MVQWLRLHTGNAGSMGSIPGQGTKILHAVQCCQKIFFFKRTSLVAQLVENPLPMWETWVQPLGGEDTLEKRKATHSSILA